MLVRISERLMRILLVGTLCTAALHCLGGCSTIRTTDPDQTATEQFLQSEATRLAVRQLNADLLRDRKVFVDISFLNSSVINSVLIPRVQEITPENQFLVAELRARLLLSGARLVEKREDCEVVVEVRTGGIGIDRSDFLLGIPGLILEAPAPGTSTPITTPELAIIQSTKQRGFASAAIVAYWRDTGEIISASGPFVGRTTRDDSWFFGFGPNSVGNIPPVQKPATTRPSN
jgi:hypothetical protein